jgi:hypothetical protein
VPAHVDTHWYAVPLPVVTAVHCWSGAAVQSAPWFPPAQAPMAPQFVLLVSPSTQVGASVVFVGVPVCPHTISVPGHSSAHTPLPLHTYPLPKPALDPAPGAFAQSYPAKFAAP